MKNSKTLDLVYISLFAVILAICSWITIPMAVPFTMQTFGVFCALNILGGKRGTLSIIVYILLGAIGLPVFSGFQGGFGTLLGATGGYIIGFIFTGLIFWLMTNLISEKACIKIIAMIIGLLLCYAFGTGWFIVVYTKNTGAIGITSALGMCVLPFVIPDLVKLALSVMLSTSVKKKVKI